ncbi:MAG: Ig-like domain-containing protein, partial [Gemmatimonadota bacterium]|nr:Ig-like domain-containing protein [Gemmatimonadota bacterium]
FALVAALAGTACGDSTAPTGITVASLEVTAPTLTIRAGNTLTLTASVHDAAGKAIDNVPVTWSSSNAAVATVSNSGVVSANAAGEVTIAASALGKSAVAKIVITDRNVATVLVLPTSVSVRIATTFALVAQTLDVDGKVLTNRAVAWSSSNTSIATVNSSGTITGIATGVATITATSEGHTATAAVTVTVSPVASVTVAPALDTLGVGTEAPLAAVLRDAAGTVLTGRVVTWSSNNIQVATVSSLGVVTALASGNAIISAASEGRQGSSAVVVLARLASAVTLTPVSTNLVAGTTVQLTSQVTDPSGNLLINRPISFTSDNNAIATVNVNGLVTGIAPGIARITATSEGKVGSATVTVTPFPVASVAVGPATAGLLVGASVQLTAQPLSSTGGALGGRTIVWTSGAPGVASVSQTGFVTAIAPGVALIVAIVDGASGTAIITVSAPAISSIVVTASAPSITVGATSQLTATLRDAAGNTIANRVVTWTTSDESIAFVNSNGLLVGLGVGNVTINATAEGIRGSIVIGVH